MSMQWRWASLDELDVLVSSRLEVLRAANQLDETADLSEVAHQSEAYYRRALADGSHRALLVWNGGKLVGTGGVSFYRVMPTCSNPTGQKAYIMNMYTAPAHRRRGVARRTLSMLVEACCERGVSFIALEATAAGRPLYAAFGFVPMQDEMILPEVQK